MQEIRASYAGGRHRLRSFDSADAQDGCRGYRLSAEDAGVPDRAGRLSREDARRLDAVRSGFLDQTRELREQIDGRRLSVRSELMRHNPNSARLARLQLELDELESRFGREVAAHRLEARRIVPGIELRTG